MGRAVVAGCKIAVLSAEPVEPIVRGRRRTRRCCCRRPSAAAAAAECIREEEERKRGGRRIDSGEGADEFTSD